MLNMLSKSHFKEGKGKCFKPTIENSILKSVCDFGIINGLHEAN